MPASGSEEDHWNGCPCSITCRLTIAALDRQVDDLVSIASVRLLEGQPIPTLHAWLPWQFGFRQK